MDLTSAQCGDLLTTWLSKQCSPDAAKSLAKEIGYNDSPMFGAMKKKVTLVSEIAMVNTALVIVAVNQVFDTSRSKSIIDSFLSIANKSIFGVFEKHDSQFKSKYENRMREYFTLLHQEKPGLGVSFAFLKYLGLDPLKNMRGQLFLAASFGESLSKTIGVLQRVQLRN